MIEIRQVLPRVAPLMFVAFLVSGCQTTPHKVEAPNTEINTQRAVERADAAYTAGQHESALAQYLLILSTDQDNVEVIEKIALINEALGNQGAAEHAYRQILQLKENHPGALSGLGMMMLNRGEKESAG